MYFIQYTIFLVLLFHQCSVNGFNIFDIDIGFNNLNREVVDTSSLSSDEEIKTLWILQETDHFNSTDKRKWQMKYFEKLTYWRENGPIYLFLGGASNANPVVPESALINELAKETHGAMYIPEHRYYGDSKPFINLSARNLQYLSSQQALADIAKLINNLKSLPMYKDSKVVVIGDSYGGNLAAWMKVLYPKLIDAAVASSAPVLAKKDYYEFLEKVKQDYEHYGGIKCLSNIEKMFENYHMLLQSPEGIKELKLKENICDASDMTVLENQQLFFFTRTYQHMMISLYGKRFINNMCNYSHETTDYRKVFNQQSKVNNFESVYCENYDFTRTINEIHDNRNLMNLYPWLYQICTEFGHFPTTSSKNQPFLNIPLEFYIKICSGLFGNNFDEKRVDKGVEISNKLYGGLKPNVTKVVFINGDIDPWGKLSILEDLSDDTQAVVVPGESHFDLSFLVDYPDFEQREARRYVKSLIKKWIGAKEHFE